MLHKKEEKNRFRYGREIIRRSDEKVISINHKNFLLPSLPSSLVKWKIQIFHAYNWSYNLQSASHLFSISFLLNSHFHDYYVDEWNENWDSWVELEILFYLARGHWKHHRMSLVTFFCNLSCIVLREVPWSFNGI